jgi:hypothetical protein
MECAVPPNSISLDEFVVQVRTVVAQLDAAKVDARLFQTCLAIAIHEQIPALADRTAEILEMNSDAPTEFMLSMIRRLREGEPDHEPPPPPRTS